MNNLLKVVRNGRGSNSRTSQSQVQRSKTDVTPAILSRDYRSRVVSRENIASVTRRVARVFRGRATLFLNRAVVLGSVRLCDKVAHSCDETAR